MFRVAWPIFAAELLLLPQSFDDGWYDSLQKPSFQPPKYAFGLAWGLLYPLLGYAYYLLLESGNERDLILFETQLAMNLVWSYVFFTLRNLHLSAAILVAMVVLNLSLYQTFRKSWYLLYIGWLCFALVLSLAAVRLN
jgi:tryptophan-rich sensory protein